jgi:hypothetical protein
VLIAAQPTASYDNPGGTTIETRNITDGTYTFEMTDLFGDGICCRSGSGSYNITVDGETVISNNGEFLFNVQETFNVGSSDVEDDCSDLLNGCSTVRYFESRIRAARGGSGILDGLMLL